MADNPQQLADKGAVFRLRQRLMAAIGEYFINGGAAAVETPMLQDYPPPEPNVMPLAAGNNRWLPASPEAAMKKLLAAERRDIFQFARVFRDDVVGDLHGTEFTMLEWYRTDGGGIEALLADCRRIFELALDLGGAEFFEYRGIRVKVGGDWQSRSVTELLGERSVTAENFGRLFHERVQPWLDSRKTPIVLTHWPPTGGEMLAAADENGIYRRAEVYICGVELANGCEELADPVQARSRLDSWRRHSGRPYDEQLVTTAAKMNGIVGMALGFDRLLMLSLAAGDIRGVQL